MLKQSFIEGIRCVDGISVPQVTDDTLCGCRVCDDIVARVRLILHHRDTQQPLPAAQIHRINGTDQSEMVGLSDNFGMFIHNEPIGSRQLNLHIIAQDFIPHTLDPITLHPQRPHVEVKVPMIPRMNLEVGHGGSPITISLGSMVAVSAPPDAFKMMETNETHSDLVRFRGNVMKSSDDNKFMGVPGNSFVGINEETNQTKTYSVLLVTYLEFQSVEGEMLTSDQLKLGVSAMNDDGSLPPLSLIYYDSDKGYWVDHGPLTPRIEVLRKKRQTDSAPTPLVLEVDGIPISVFVAVTTNENANCWLQARTFAEDGSPFPTLGVGQGNGPLVSLMQRSDIAGNQFLFQFGTDTGNSANADLELNAICLPLRCDTFTVATLEAREDMDFDSPSLLPNSFPDGIFNTSASAPLEIGVLFTWNELFFPSDSITPSPFYPDLASCQTNAQESNTAAERGDYFSFQIQQEIDVPVSTDTCFIKIQIRDCFASNEVTVTSINPLNGIIDDSTTTTVERSRGRKPSKPFNFRSNPFPCTLRSTLKAACLPFVCGDRVQIVARPNPESSREDLCQITGRSLLVNTEAVSDVDENEQLIIGSSSLKRTDYNDPNLGLYFDEGNGILASVVAEAICNAGTGVDISSNLNVKTGVAASFSCL